MLYICVCMFSYFKTHHNSRLVLDPTYRDIDMVQFKHHNWKQLYGGVKEIISLNAPNFLGKEFLIRAYVETDFAGDNLTRRSQYGFIIIVQIVLLFFGFQRSSHI